MIATSLAMLFVAAAAVALGVIVDSGRRHGRALLALRGQIRDCPEMREFRFTILTTEVRRAGATIYRPDFRPTSPNLPRRNARRAA